MQNKSLPNIEWTADEAAVFLRLTQHRQSTSTELIKYCGIQNPHGLVATMQQKLAGTEWQIFSSVMRTADPKKVPIAYYRLLRKPLSNLK